LSETPTERPSFQEIFDVFKASEWKIVPDVDPNTIETAVSEVIAWENLYRHFGLEAISPPAAPPN
jgi:hypothetical protein